MFTLREEWAGIVLGTCNMFTLREEWAGIVLGISNMFTLREEWALNCLRNIQYVHFKRRVGSNCLLLGTYTICSL